MKILAANSNPKLSDPPSARPRLDNEGVPWSDSVRTTWCHPGSTWCQGGSEHSHTLFIHLSLKPRVEGFRIMRKDLS